ncbi:hydrogenase formation protein HypD [Hippea jasoniae]|uniref:hydrogenase formation protein HypD n=1 Tax=Hippea jasoniae TaxID=944479 RepID=UPI00054E6114|nr:hydrogenase formation protein HypD [Hippea jasoniae]
MNLELFSDPQIVKKLAKAIQTEAAKLKKEIKIMHICGTHENSIIRFGLRDLLPANIRVIAGPGCPVCVTSSRDIDAVINLALKENVCITTFGDMLKVPGSKLSLHGAKSHGADIKMVYSIYDAIELSKNSNKPVVFFACGFETTAAGTAAAILDLKLPSNFFIYSVHKYTPDGVYALLKSGKIDMDGLILPGHASAISGLRTYERFAFEFHIPSVAAGFEAADILLAILLIVKQINSNQAKVENTYNRVINYEGNTKAQQIMDRVFSLGEAIWRGLGTIEHTGYILKDEFAYVDATKHFNFEYPNHYIEHKKGCRCRDVILGKAQPTDCPLYAKHCTPYNPVGPCMVSDEGTCKNFYDGGIGE